MRPTDRQNDHHLSTLVVKTAKQVAMTTAMNVVLCILAWVCVLWYRLIAIAFGSAPLASPLLLWQLPTQLRFTAAIALYTFASRFAYTLLRFRLSLEC